MDAVLKENSNNLIKIYRQVYKDYKWKNSSNMNNLIALAHIMNEKEYSREAINTVNQYIARKTGPFSCYRQKSILFSALLALSFPDPENKFDTLQEYEMRLKDAGFRSYTYRPVTAYTLLLTCDGGQIDERIAKGYEIFTRMRKDHPWLTSGDDYPLSILLASSQDSVDTIMKEIEDLYNSLHRIGFNRGNGLQYLAHILSLSSENYEYNVSRCKALYDYFRQNNMKVYSSNYGALGLLTLMADRSQEAAQDVLIVNKYLREDRTIRWLGKETLFLTAVALASNILLRNLQNSKVLIEVNSCVTIEHLIAAQTAAMLGATCAATAVAANY